MRRKLAGLLALALLLACMNSPALALLSVGQNYYVTCPKCNSFGCTVNTVTPKAEGHEIKFVCMNFINGLPCYNSFTKMYDHSGGTATCTGGKLCTDCGYEYTARDPDNHASTAWVWDQTATAHQKVLECCGEPCSSREDHSWSKGKCSICDYSCAHNYINGVCSICRAACTHADGHAEWRRTLTTHQEFWSCCGAACNGSEAEPHFYDGNNGRCRTCLHTCPHPSEYREAATCVSGPKCTLCNMKLGDAVPTAHPEGELDYAKVDANTHQFICLICRQGILEPESHNWYNGNCAHCGYTCLHPSWIDGECATCGLPCAHDWRNKDGVCTKCHSACTEVPEGATCRTAVPCSVCGSEHTNPAVHESSDTHYVSLEVGHQLVRDCCNAIESEDKHSWSDGECTACDYACLHTDTIPANCKNVETCANCGKAIGSSTNPSKHIDTEPIYFDLDRNSHQLQLNCCRVPRGPVEAHTYQNGYCSKCNHACSHTWREGVCVNCEMPCTHDWSNCDGKCGICLMVCSNYPKNATCTTPAVCEVCGISHTNPAVHDASCTLQWTTTEATHKQTYSGCGEVKVEEAAHRWGHGQCKDCGYVCTHSSGTQEWRPIDLNNHAQYWTCCGNRIDNPSEDHCWNNGKCTVCCDECEHGLIIDGVCYDCGLGCTNAPVGATCITAEKCTACGKYHTNPNEHDSSCTLQWTTTEATHKQTYSGCGEVKVEEAAHRWSNGKCSDCNKVCLHNWVNGVCTQCDLVCTHDWADGVCKTCKSTCAHDYDSATGICRTCKLACSHDKTAVDAAVAPTCTQTGLTEGKHCTTCGKVLVEQQAVKALGHDYRAEATTPGSASGEVRYRCARCGDIYTVEMDHQYGEWTDNGDGTHSVACPHDGCGYVATVECARYELTVDEVPVGVCPICGKFGDARCRIIGEAMCEPIDEAPLPEGELLVRGLDLPMGEEAVAIAGLEDEVVPVYSFTFVFASDGQVVDLNAAVRLRVPMELDGGFRLLRLDVPDDATDDAPDDAEERWTELTYVYADGVLDFETDAAGLFLLLPLDEA